MPQIRANLAHASSNKIARSFGIEAILDNVGPKGSLRRLTNESDIACITFEGGGPNESDPESVQISIYGILNVLRGLRMIPGHPSRPRFRILASGSVWIRSDQGGLLDVLAPAGSFVEEGEVVATVTDRVLMRDRQRDGIDNGRAFLIINLLVLRTSAYSLAKGGSTKWPARTTVNPTSTHAALAF